MNPTLFASLVATAILVLMLGMGSAALLLLRTRTHIRLRARVHRDGPVAHDFSDAADIIMLPPAAA